MLTAMLTMTALAGSKGETFSFGFSEERQSARQSGHKSDAGTSSGNYATVVVQTCTARDGTPYANVQTRDGTVVTPSYGFTTTGTTDMPYRTSVTNGLLYLYGWSERGACGITGIWYP